jgi:hypothetical protein
MNTWRATSSRTSWTYDEAAPFGTSDNGLYNNAVNGFVGSDGWKQINDFPMPKTARDFSLHTAKPQTIKEFVWDASVNYNPTTKVGLVVDGKKQTWDGARQRRRAKP